MKPLLLIGYGNPGRGDDGLGPALVDRLQALNIPHLALQSDYQLTVDMAHDVAAYRHVVFADAAMNGEEPFSVRPLHPGAPTSFTSHSQSPEGVLGLARVLFGAQAHGQVLGIRGYRFGQFSEHLSAAAEHNLCLAVQFVRDFARSLN